MDIKVKVYVNGVYVPHSDLSKYVVRSPTIDRIVNDILKNRVEFTDVLDAHPEDSDTEQASPVMKRKAFHPQSQEEIDLHYNLLCGQYWRQYNTHERLPNVL